MTPPKTIEIKTDGNILEFVRIDVNPKTKEKRYIYVYTKSITKLGLEIPMDELSLNKLIERNK